MPVKLRKITKTPPNFMTVMMQSISVYHNGQKIGYSWVFYNDVGPIMQELVANDGSILPPAWYNIQIDDTEPILAVLPKAIQ